MGVREMNENEIRGYLDSDGRVTLMPPKRKKKLLVLAYLADRIPPDKVYTEREFNELLNTLHTFGDAAILRRELFDYYLVNRSQDGKNYSLNKDRMSAEQLVERYC